MKVVNQLNTIDETWDDPILGTDKAWDSLTDTEKSIFRNPVIPLGKSLSDLIRDRDAIDGDCIEVLSNSLTASVCDNSEVITINKN